MKFNISYPVTGQQKCFDIDDEKRVSIFYDKRIGVEVQGDTLGDDFKGFIFKVTGGMDKDGFPMKQGILVKGRVRILLKAGQKCNRKGRKGERKRKSVRGCIVGADLAVLSLKVVKKGDKDIEGLTNQAVPRRLGPKRANHIRKLYGLKKEDDVRRYVIRRTITKEGKKPRTKAPRIQRLITAERLRRKHVFRKSKIEKVVRNQKALTEYLKMKADWKKKQAGHHAPAAVKAVEAPKKEETKKPVDTKKPAPAAGGKKEEPKKGAPAPAGKAPAPAPAAGGKKEEPKKDVKKADTKTAKK